MSKGKLLIGGVIIAVLLASAILYIINQTQETPEQNQQTTPSQDKTLKNSSVEQLTPEELEARREALKKSSTDRSFTEKELIDRRELLKEAN